MSDCPILPPFLPIKPLGFFLILLCLATGVGLYLRSEQIRHAGLREREEAVKTYLPSITDPLAQDLTAAELYFHVTMGKADSSLHTGLAIGGGGVLIGVVLVITATIRQRNERLRIEKMR